MERKWILVVISPPLLSIYPNRINFVGGKEGGNQSWALGAQFSSDKDQILEVSPAFPRAVNKFYRAALPCCHEAVIADRILKDF